MNKLDNELKILLKEAGLNKSETQVYLAAEVFKAHRSSEIIQKVGLPRATVLAALKSLTEFGLCQSTKDDGRSYLYTMQPLGNLKPFIGKQLQRFDKLLENLSAHEAVNDNLSVRQGHGQDELQSILELALRCRSRQWRIIAPHDSAIRFLPKSYTEYFKKVRQERQILSQTLWEPALKNQQIALKDVLMRKPRYVPKAISENIPCLMLAFDDYILIIEGTKNPSTVLVQNAAATKTFEIIFDMAWQSVKN